MKMVEFRVRPVTRYILTKYVSGFSEVSVETVGEFPSARHADVVGRAMCESTPNSMFLPSDGPAETNGKRQYAIVQSSFEVEEQRVYYADTPEEAERVRADAELGHGREFRIFSRAAQ